MPWIFVGGSTLIVPKKSQHSSKAMSSKDKGRTGQSYHGSTSVEDLLPAHLHNLSLKYNFINQPISSSAKMQSKVRTLIGLLQQDKVDGPDRRANVVVMQATAKCASKMIAILEIVKRELSREKIKFWQYSSLGGITQSVKLPVLENPRKQQHSAKDIEIKQSADALEESIIQQTGASGETQGKEEHSYPEEGHAQNDFETMPSHLQQAGDTGSTKIRRIPLLTVFMTTVQIPDLARVFR